MTEREALCRRCLLSEYAEGRKLYELIREYIDAIPEDGRVDSKEYARRLALCRQCDELVNGMCRQCGCYVEVRAVRAGQMCPGIGRKW